MGKSNRAVRPDGAILTSFQYRVLCVLCDSAREKNLLDRRETFVAVYRLPWKTKPTDPWKRFSQHCGLMVASGLATKIKSPHKITRYVLTEYGVNVLLNDYWYYENHAHH